MAHDKIRQAALARAARTGEPYATARQRVIEEHTAQPAAPPGRPEADPPPAPAGVDVLYPFGRPF